MIFNTDFQINRIKKLYALFNGILAKGIKIHICLSKTIDEDVLQYLQGITTSIINIHYPINAILIDEKELWTGSCSYFGRQPHDLYFIRTHDEELIEEIKMMI